MPGKEKVTPNSKKTWNTLQNNSVSEAESPAKISAQGGGTTQPLSMLQKIGLRLGL
jgi:hypothetical protein